MNFTTLPRCILAVLPAQVSKAFAVEPRRSAVPSHHSGEHSRGVSSNRVGVTTRSPWVALLLALALSGCWVPARDVGDRIAQFDYPDAGVKCFLYKPSTELAGSLSCVRVSP